MVKKGQKNIILLLATVFVVLIDQLTKFLTRRYIIVNESIPVIKNILRLTYRQNTGAAFGILQDQNLFLIIVSFIVLAGAIYFCLKSKEFLLRLLLSLLSAGIIGNLIDRIVFGYVIDFIDFRIWPVFNIADSIITLTIIGLIIYLWKK
ncbi:signal peptidase II [Candidatus Woesearchaeota archaeon]|nr:signal peptidase II [Candidatus Woesearchaeota archaeon]